MICVQRYDYFSNKPHVCCSFFQLKQPNAKTESGGDVLAIL